MTKNVHMALASLCLGISVVGCQGMPGLLGPVVGSAGGDSPFPGSGIVANNAASLSGQVFAPSSLVANNSAALVGNNSAALVSNNAAAYRTMALKELPVIKAEVEAVRDGQVVAKASTDETGRYSLSGLTKERAYLVRVSFTLDGQKFQELAIAKTLTQQTSQSVNSASTLVTAKILTRGTALEQVNMARYYDTLNLVAAAQTSIAPSALTSTQASSDAFDQVSESNEQVASTFSEALTPTTASPDPTPTPTPTATPAATSYSPRDYFFPPSATAQGQFTTTTTKEYPKSSNLPTEVSTDSFSVKVVVYTAGSATLERKVGDFAFPSELVLTGGQVKIDTMTMGTPVFTSEGTTVTPYGAPETVRYSLLAANQQVTVKAGSYACVKLLETSTANQVTSQRMLWYAKGIGIGPVKVLTTSTEPTQSGLATTSVETVLTSFTP